MSVPTGAAMWKLLTVADGDGFISSASLYYSPCGAIHGTWSGGWEVEYTQVIDDLVLMTNASGSWKSESASIALYTSTVDNPDSWTACTATVGYNTVPVYEDAAEITISDYTHLVPSGGGNLFYLWMGSHHLDTSWHPATPGPGGVLDSSTGLIVIPLSSTVSIPEAGAINEYTKIFLYNSGTATAHDVRVHMYSIDSGTGAPIYDPLYYHGIALGTIDDDIDSASGYAYSQPLSRASGVILPDVSSDSSAAFWMRRRIPHSFPSGTYSMGARISYNQISSSGVDDYWDAGISI